MKKTTLNQLEDWILDYEKINGTPTMCEIKAQLEMFKEVENGSFVKPMLDAFDIKDNRIMLLEEDLLCVHKYLDDLELPKANKDGKEYSIVERIKILEERYLKELSELQTMHQY